MPPPRAPLHPFLQEALVIGARVGAKTLAGAATSFLREVGLGAKAVQKKTVKARRQIKKKLVEIDPEIEEANEDDEDEDE